MENKQTLISESVLTSSKFIDGCTSYKAESIAYHENSAAHKLASQYHKAKQNSEKNPRIFGQATVAKTVQREIEVVIQKYSCSCQA